MTREDVLAFIKSKNHAVITTVGSDGQPEAALIGFGETDDFEIICGTYKTSRKYKNLKTNNKVALVVGLGDGLTTVQYEGIATELNWNEDIDKYTTLLFAKIPEVRVFKSHPEQSYWKIVPKWVRYTDLAGEKENIAEFTF